MLGGVSPFETWRLISAGDTGSTLPGQHNLAKVNRLDDFKNVLFAIDSYQYASIKAFEGLVEGDKSQLVNKLSSFIPSQFAISYASGNVLPFIQYVTKGTPIEGVVSTILTYGTSKFLAMIQSSYTGSYVKAGSDFSSDAFDFFSKITSGESQSTVVKMLTEYDDWQSAATKNDALGASIRGALKTFSTIVVERPIGVDRGVALYDVNTGEGDITANWLADRIDMLKFLPDKYGDSPSSFSLQKFSYTDADSQYQVTMPTGVNNPLVFFGSDLGSAFPEGQGGIIYMAEKATIRFLAWGGTTI